MYNRSVRFCYLATMGHSRSADIFSKFVFFMVAILSLFTVFSIQLLIFKKCETQVKKYIRSLNSTSSDSLNFTVLNFLKYMQLLKSIFHVVLLLIPIFIPDLLIYRSFCARVSHSKREHFIIGRRIPWKCQW